MNAVFAMLLFAAAPTSRDRVYTADQTSNTVTVIDAGTNRNVGELVLGAPRTEVLSPIYRGQALVHGLGFSPDHRTLLVVSIATNSVSYVDTATNKVRATAYVGRAPHEALSDREYQVLRMIARGRTVSQIAAELGLSVKTVSTYRSRILEKMKMTSTAELMHYAISNRLV